MIKSTLAVFLALSATLSAGGFPEKKSSLDEWKRTRLALEKSGFKVNHFADTPAEIAREQASIRLQVQQLTDPTANTPAHRYGGGNPITPSPRIRKAPPVGKLGATRKIN